MDREKRVALITGITGQDGRHLAALLGEKGYNVFGLIRGQYNPRREQLVRELPFVKLLEGDMTDPASLVRAVEVSAPDELYNFAAVSHVGYSFQHPTLTMEVTGKGVLNVLEAIRLAGRTHETRMYQASTSEMFGGSADAIPALGYNEESVFHPRSPYGVAKLYGHWIAKNYRETYGMFVACGLLFNHEGEHRGAEFVTRKITRAAARISLGLQDYVTLGSLWPRRDWGYAGDYVRGIWMMMQHHQPADFVLATGTDHSIEEFLAAAFQRVGISEWREHVRLDPSLIRAIEVDHLRGDSSKAEGLLGWRREVGFEDLVTRMVAHDLAELRRCR